MMLPISLLKAIQSRKWLVFNKKCYFLREIILFVYLAGSRVIYADVQILSIHLSTHSLQLIHFRVMGRGWSQPIYRFDVKIKFNWMWIWWQNIQLNNVHVQTRMLLFALSSFLQLSHSLVSLLWCVHACIHRVNTLRGETLVMPVMHEGSPVYISQSYFTATAKPTRNVFSTFSVWLLIWSVSFSAKCWECCFMDGQLAKLFFKISTWVLNRIFCLALNLHGRY